MHRVSILMQVVACYREASVASPVPVRVSAPEPVARPAPCPTGDALQARAAALVGASEIEYAACVAGRFPQPGWMITARYPGDGMWIERRMVIGPSGEVVAFDDTEQQRSTKARSSTDRSEAFDFDRDGLDEIVSVLSSSYRGYELRHLQILRLVASRWEPVLTREIEYDDTAAVGTNAVRCEAKWRISGRTVVVEPVTTATGHCVASSERWSLGPAGTFVRD